ncbi:MAG TPA: glycosyltransferase family 2 protein [Candidatus Paceibacterota bacterium]
MLSVIIPVFNEEDNVAALHKELLGVLDKLGSPFEIIFINDGSTDKTLEYLSKLKRVRIVNLRKRSGQSSAFDVGFKICKGEIIVTMDGDLQNDPADIPNLLGKLSEGYDVVCGWRFTRRDPLLNRFMANCGRMLRKYLLGDKIHDSGCSLRVYRREVLGHLDLYGEMHRMITAILSLEGYRLAEIKVNHRKRLHGKTKYNMMKALKGFIDIINTWLSFKYRGRPLHLLGGIGLLMFGIGTILSTYFAIIRLVFNMPLADRVLPIASLFLVLFGVQLFAVGFLADIMIKNVYNSDKKNWERLVKDVVEL